MYYYWLDFYDLFVNEIAGSWTIFLALMLIGVFYFAARYRFPDAVISMIFIVMGLLFSPFSTLLKVLAIFAVGVFIAWNLRRLYTNY